MNSRAARVLDLLRRKVGEPCSGEDLSNALGVSRTQIWKHVETLRADGYGIEGEPGGGYRLTSVPDRLYPEEIQNGLETHWLAREIHYFDSIASTNDEAFDLGRKGCPHGATVIAESQSAGRGRHGRSFYSPAYSNLYCSMVVRPDLDVTAAPTLILASAVAVADSVAATVGDDDAVQIKWPNDVLLGGLKTSGILMEMSSEATRVGFLVLGIGINLNVKRADFPEDFRATATSLSSHVGTAVDRVSFARLLFGNLEDVLDLHAKGGFEAIRPRFDARFRMQGEPVSVRDMGGPITSGLAEGIAEDGALLVRTDEGELKRVLAGDVTLVPPGGAR